MALAGTPSNSSTPGLPSAAVAYAAAAAASLANNNNQSQSQSLLALSASVPPKAPGVGENSSTTTTPTPTTTLVDTQASVALGSPGQTSTSAQLLGSNSSFLNDEQTDAGATDDQSQDQGQEVENDPNNNNLYSLTGNGSDDNNNNNSKTNKADVSSAVAVVAASASPPVDEPKAREIPSSYAPKSALPSHSQSPVLAYSSASYSYMPSAPPVSYHYTPSHSSAHATQSYALPISASGMYANHSGAAALLGHSPQHMYADAAAGMLAKEAAQKNFAMKMVSQSLSGKPLTAAYPPQFAAHMAQMQKAMHPGVMQPPAGHQAQAQAHAHAHAAAAQQNAAQFAAVYAAQYHHQQQHANAVAASTAQTGFSHHQFTPQRYSASSLNGQGAMLAQGQNSGVQPTPQLFPGYARAPAPPQAMFMQPPHLMRPQMPGQSNPQFYPGNLFYSGYPQVAAAAAGMASPLAAATANSAGVSPNMHAIQAVQQAQSANSTGSALGLNPYKKMKTS